MWIKNKQQGHSSVKVILMCFFLTTELVHAPAAYASEPEQKDEQRCPRLVDIEITNTNTYVDAEDAAATEYLSNAYVVLSNEFHRMLEEENKPLSEGRLCLLLNSSRRYEIKAAQEKNGYWIRQFKVLSNSLSVALEVSRAAKELEDAKKDRDAHKKEHEAGK